MTLSVQQCVEAMQRLGLLAPRELEAVRTRWFRAGRPEADDPAKFRQWLVTNRFLTPFAFDVVHTGQGEQLVLNQYRVLDHLKTGPLAGAYLAADSLHRRVVLQIVSRKISADPARLERVRRIVQEGIKLDHPNVCRVLDFGEARGRHYLVREYDEATTLTDVLARRGRLSAEQAAKIFAVAFEGLRALHEHQVPGGLLTADCLLLATTGKGPGATRTVRLLVTAARSNVFDRWAIAGAADPGALVMPDDPGLIDLSDGQETTRPATPEEDLLRMGALFYQCVTGNAPFPPDQLPKPTRQAEPVAQATPDVPEALAQLIDGMIDPNPAHRPKTAAHAAKAIRVFVQAQAEAREVREEEQVVVATRRRQPPPDEDEADEKEEAAPRRTSGQSAAAPKEGAAARFQDLWEEIRPQQRDWVFLASGVAVVVILVLLVELVTGLRFVHVVLLLAGAAISFLVERAAAWWSAAGPDPAERET